MSFGVNPANNKPLIREAATMNNDGGGGNLGYFENDEQKKKQQSGESIFSNKEELDSFNKESDRDADDEKFSLSGFIANIIFSIKEWFNKLFR